MRRLLGLVLLIPTAVFAADRYASTSGSGSTCSVGTPCTISTALAAGLTGGDTIWLRAGTYTGPICPSAFDGLPGNPVTIRPYNHEHVEIVYNGTTTACAGSAIVSVWGGATTPKGHYVRFQDLDIHQQDTNQIRESDAVPAAIPSGTATICTNAKGVGTEFINNWMHDCNNGLDGGSGTGTGKHTYYGNVVYNIGYVSSDFGHGHSHYLQNCDNSSEANCRSVVRDDISWGSMGQSDYQIYCSSSGCEISYLTVDNNIIYPPLMNASATWTLGYTTVVFGSSGTVSNGCPDTKMANEEIFSNNVTYNQTGTAGGIYVGYNKGSCKFSLTDNYFANTLKGPSFTESSGKGTYGPLTITGNTFMMAPASGNDGAPVTVNSTNYPTNTWLSSPPSSGKVWKYRPNQYEAGRGYANLVNWDGSATVSLDLAQMGGYSGEKYKVFNALDPNPYTGTAIATGTCGTPCGSITVSTTAATIAAPYGTRADGTTPIPSYPDQGPTFVTYILYPDWAAIASTPTPSPTATFTKTNTPSPTRTATPTFTPTVTNTATVTPSQSPTATRTSTASPTNTATFTPSRTPTITQTPGNVLNSPIAGEFENCAVTAPMAPVNDATVSGGQYVSSPTQNQGLVACTINVPIDGTYRMWTRVKSDSNATGLGDSFFIDVDGDGSPGCVTDGNTTCTHIFDTAEAKASDQTLAACGDTVTTRNVWIWNPVNDRSGTNGYCSGVATERDFVLSAGTHVFSFRQRDPGAALDRFILTSDFSFTPNDSTLTPTPRGGGHGRLPPWWNRRRPTPKPQ